MVGSSLLSKLALFPLFAAILCLPVDAEECGRQAGAAKCPSGLCCSQYGWCGSTFEYCAQACQSQCWSPPPARAPGPPPTRSTPGSAMKRLAYFANWASYRDRAYAFYPENITAKHYSHVLYAFATLHPKTFAVIPTDPELDLGPDTKNQPQKGFLYRFNKVVHAGRAKTLISIGGGSGPALSKLFSTMAKSNTTRLAFVNSAIQFARKYGFDGIDMDWEIPSTAADKANFVSLLRTFRSQISADRQKTKKAALLLTAAVAAWKPDVLKAYDVPSLNKYLDWANVMTYDFHGSWDDVTGEHTALADPSDSSVSTKGAVKAWLDLGLSRKKLVVGLAAYGHSWTLANGKKTGVGAPTTGKGYAGPITKDTEGGSWAFFEIQEYFVNKGATSVFDKTTSSVYAFKGLQWIGYDNTKSIALKAKYAQVQGLAGYMFWSLDQDDKYALAIAAKAATT